MSSIADYLGSKLVLFLGWLFMYLSPPVYIWLGKMFGRIAFYLDKKHRDITWRNLRFVFRGEKTPRESLVITQRMFENFGRNLFEAIALKKISKKYIEKYVEIEGRHFIDEALAKKKGLIFVTLHLGNWEVSNAACGLLYQPYNVIVKPQKHSRLNGLLDNYRKSFGVKTITLDSLRDTVRALENNEIVSIVCDHDAGKGDVLVNFFGRPASMPQGAVRLAGKFKTPILFAYIIRAGGPYQKIVVEPFANFSDCENDVALMDNLLAINKKFESYIRKYPEEYLWPYKKWKHSKERSILILSDGKTGHLRQSEAVEKIISELGFNIESKIIQIKFKNKFSRLFLIIYFYIFGIRNSYLYGLKYALDKECYDKIEENFSDIVISCGARGALINLIASYQNKAKSIHILRASSVPIKKINLVVMPRHDQTPSRENVVVTDGALNLIDEGYLKEQAEKLLQVSSSKYPCLAGRQEVSSNCIGFLVGGDTKNFHLDEKEILEAVRQIKAAADRLNADILITTSRRTSQGIGGLIKEEFGKYPRCKLLVIANENNIPEAVGGILGISSLIITTAESISMVSEAASSGKIVLVIATNNLDKRHKEFLLNLKEQGYIYLTEIDRLNDAVKDIISRNPVVKILKDREEVKKKLSKIL